MRFKQFILLEQEPMAGGGMGMDPMAGGGMDPMAGGGMGMDPMGGGGMGMDPMGGGGMGMDPMGGDMGGAEPPIIPKSLDVWAVLDHILNQKPLPSKKAPEQNQQEDPMMNMDPMAGNEPAPPMGMDQPPNAPQQPQSGLGPALMG